jgi:hypothetical protein
VEGERKEKEQFGSNFTDMSQSDLDHAFPLPPHPPSTMVRLITHNLLACHAKDCNTNNFPLAFKDAQLEIREAEFNPEFLKGFLPKIEWTALVNTAREVGDHNVESS